MTSFFSRLRKPGTPNAPIEVDDLRREVAALSSEIADSWDTSVFRDDKRDELLEVVTDAAFDHIAVTPPDTDAIKAMIHDMIAREPLLSARPRGVTGLDYRALLQERARLLRLRATLVDPRLALDCLIDSIGTVLGLIYDGLPSVGDGIRFETRLVDAKSDIPETIDAIFTHLARESGTLAKFDLLPAWRAQLSQNAHRVAGVPEGAAQKDFDRGYKTASEQKAAPEQLLAMYLAGFPFARVFNMPWSISLPTKLRFEHHHVCASSGAGKTNLYGEMLLQDLDQVAQGKASVVVLDHSGRFIEEHLVKLKAFAGAGPIAVGSRVQVTVGGVDQFVGGTTVIHVDNDFVFIAGSASAVPIADVSLYDPCVGPLHDRLVYIDPTDVDFPIQLNIFARTGSAPAMTPYERDREVNKLVSLLNFIFSALDQTATGRQKTLLQAVAHIMLAIPGAGLKELNQLFAPPSKLSPNPLAPFLQYLVKLEPHMQQFCEQQFNSSQFAATRDQIAPRIQALIVESTLYRMFSAPEQKLDLVHELDRGAAVLINCKKDFLQDNTQIFGRFFIALLRQAINARAAYPEDKLMPTFVYIDEAHTWIKDDPNVQDILETARKFKVGILLAHQALYQMGDKVTSALQMTSIKMAARLTEQDLRTLPAQLRTTPEFIRARPAHSFALWMAGLQNAVAIQVPVGRLHAAPKMTADEFAEVRNTMRRKYASVTGALGSAPPPSASPTPAPPAPMTGAITSPLPSSSHGASAHPAAPQGAPPSTDDINTRPSTTWRPPPPK